MAEQPSAWDTICMAPETGDVAVLLSNAVQFGRRNTRMTAARDLLAAYITGQEPPAPAGA